MEYIVFRRSPIGDFVASWLWIALWIYVGMRIERRRARKLRETVLEEVRLIELQRDGASRELTLGDWKF